MHRTRTGVAAVAGSCVLVTACGGGAQPLEASFRARVNAVCQQAVDDKQGHTFPLPNFDPHHPQAAQLPTVGAYFAAYGDAQLIVDRLAALGEPARGAARWDRLRTLVDQASANSLVQQRVAAAKDVAGFEHTLDVAQSLGKQIDQLGPRLGFTSKTACGRYFG
jgi:hypothetical protein